MFQWHILLSYSTVVHGVLIDAEGRKSLHFLPLVSTTSLYRYDSRCLVLEKIGWKRTHESDIGSREWVTSLGSKP